MKLAPLKRGAGNEFINRADSETIPEAFIPVIEKSVMESLESGCLSGYPVADVRVALTGGVFKENFGSELGFRVCAAMTCQEALKKCEPFFLEPLMNVEVFAPENFVGDVIGDLNSRGGKVSAINADSGIHEIKVLAPLSKMFGYSTQLRSLTQGRGVFTMRFSHFDKV